MSLNKKISGARVNTGEEVSLYERDSGCLESPYASQ